MTRSLIVALVIVLVGGRQGGATELPPIATRGVELVGLRGVSSIARLGDELYVLPERGHFVDGLTVAAIIGYRAPDVISRAKSAMTPANALAPRRVVELRMPASVSLVGGNGLEALLIRRDGDGVVRCFVTYESDEVYLLCIFAPCPKEVWAADGVTLTVERAVILPRWGRSSNRGYEAACFVDDEATTVACLYEREWRWVTLHEEARRWTWRHQRRPALAPPLDGMSLRIAGMAHHEGSRFVAIYSDPGILRFVMMDYGSPRARATLLAGTAAGEVAAGRPSLNFEGLQRVPGGYLLVNDNSQDLSPTIVRFFTDGEIGVDVVENGSEP